MQFKEVIKAYLEQKKMKSSELAKRLGFKAQDVENWLIGLNLPKYGDRYKILKAVNCKIKVQDPDNFVFNGLTLPTKYSMNNKMEYYRSEDWRRISKKRIDLAGNQCELCGSTKDLVVHHLTYERWGGNEQMQDMLCVCDNCHKIIHKDKKAVNRAIDERNERLKKILVLNTSKGSTLYEFTVDCSDAQIKQYVKSLELKYGVKYKEYFIMKQENKELIDSGKLSLMISNNLKTKK